MRLCRPQHNRKNALFADSDPGGIHWGVIASLIETCKLNGVDPPAYLASTLTRLVNRGKTSVTRNEKLAVPSHV